MVKIYTRMTRHEELPSPDEQFTFSTHVSLYASTNLQTPELEAQFAQERAEYESIIQDTDLYNYFGNRVVESRTTGGRLVAVKVKPRLAFHRKSPKFALTHGDLAARNILVHGAFVSGVVDWEYSGFYPEYMEYALATVIHDNIEQWWLPVLKEILEPCGFLRARIVSTIKNRGF
ncbi:hypothetical protein BO70DRAFT_395428 [Aspergillus heteromorphus CBS 117.55]|uniref:non-specific serine/threonine protein kinase n=1 Tax=Aspergillus heteromorphus CBS 117.55 TaxID=1448321 RepID=A0A317WI64_9EURO|nr:uncharacterized protein BO70DRAFT_395428 [Aspergillus heteromorphus CBS 117.55]PWY84748.1 hypothetical protein BO70DRAFT_395428 [Aspergillus heteromorphus CBS 117.55]